MENVPIEPDEVEATGGEGFTRLGAEVPDRPAFRPASRLRLRLVRGRRARVEDAEAASLAASEEGVSVGAERARPARGDAADEAQSDGT